MIRIELLGGLRATRDAAPLDSLLSQRLRSSVVAYLAAEQTVSREALLRLFWPDRESERARHVLSQMLYELRRDIGSDCVEAHGERLVMSTSCEVDVVQFEKLAAAGLYDQALPLYRGSFLANVPLPENAELEHWADARRAQLSRSYRKVVRAVVEQHVTAGQVERAAAVALQAAGVEPLEDEFHHLAIDLLARCGKRAEALRHFELYQSLLMTAQLTPLDETRQLVEDIRAGRVAGSPLQALPERSRAPRNASVSLRAADAAATSGQRISQVLVAGAFVLTITFIFTWGARRDDFPIGTPADRTLVTADAELLPDRVAIVPFETSGSNPDRAGSEQLHGNIITDLARSPLLDVVPRATVQREWAARGRTADVARSVKSLLVVTGTISADTVVRLTLHVYDGATDRQLATRTFEQAGNGAGLALLQTQAVDYLSAELTRTLGYLRHRRDARSGEALRLFEEALNRYYNSNVFAVDNSAMLRALASADSLLAKSEKIDQDWIAPTLLRVELALRAGSIARPEPGTDALYHAAYTHAQRALARHPRAVDALEMRGVTAYELWRWIGQKSSVDSVGLRERAKADLEAVIAADAKRSRSLVALAHIQDIRGQYQAAWQLAQQALQVDPTSSRESGIFYRLAIESMELGREQQALEWCRRGRARYPEYLNLQYCELAVYAYGDSLAPDVSRAWQITSEVARAQPQQAVIVPLFEMLTAAVLARAGLADSAQAVARRANAAAPGNVSLMSPEAALWTRLGQADRAVRVLEADARIDPVGMRSTLLKRVFIPLRTHPGFQRLYHRFVGNPATS